MVYLSIYCNSTFILYVINLILQDLKLNEYFWLNLRVLHQIIIINIIPYAIWNAIIKYRGYLYFSEYSLPIIVDFVLFIIFKDPLYSIFGIPTSKLTYHVFSIGVIGLTITELQFEYGSRFFLPNRCRAKRYEYRRIISQDYELAKLDKSMWPDWDLWMQKLHQPSLYAENINCQI